MPSDEEIENAINDLIDFSDASLGGYEAKRNDRVRDLADAKANANRVANRLAEDHPAALALRKLDEATGSDRRMSEGAEKIMNEGRRLAAEWHKSRLHGE